MSEPSNLSRALRLMQDALELLDQATNVDDISAQLDLAVHRLQDRLLATTRPDVMDEAS